MMASSCGRDRSSPRDGSGFGRIGCLLHQAEEHAIMNRVETEDSSYASARNRKLLAEWAAKTGENEYAEPALNPCQTTAYAFFTGDYLVNVDPSSASAVTPLTELACSARQALSEPGRNSAMSLRVEAETALPARTIGSKSVSACCAPGCPTKARGPSGNMTMSPCCKVLSVRRSGTALVTSPGALGLSGGFIAG